MFIWRNFTLVPVHFVLGAISYATNSINIGQNLIRVAEVCEKQYKTDSTEDFKSFFHFQGIM